MLSIIHDCARACTGRRALLLALGCGVGMLAAEEPVWAAEPASAGLSNEPAGQSHAPKSDGPPPTRWEPSIIPELSYDSNIGFELGAIGTLARFDPRYDPFRFRLEAQVFVGIAVNQAHHVELPYHDHFIRGDFPGLFHDRLRLLATLAFGKLSNSGYYGLGQLAPRRHFSDAELEHSETARRYQTYDRVSPHADLLGQIMLKTIPKPRRDSRLALLVGASAGFEGIGIYQGSKLEEDVRERAQQTAHGRELASLLHGVEDQGVGSIALGILWDTRDHDFAPSHGSLTEVSTRLSFARGRLEKLGFARFHVSSSWYTPIFRDVIVFAHRSSVDWLVGDAPFYELSQFGVAHLEEGPGGDGSVRGVLLRRYHGKVQLVENLEVRLQAPWFTVFGARFRVGAVGFVDAGRVWASIPAHRDLDGPWAPFAAGVGGGLRLRWGETVILRSDLAFSPTDHTTGFSVDLGHVF